MKVGKDPSGKGAREVTAVPIDSELNLRNRAGDWDVENHGVSPDFDVELTPTAWRQNHDPQLEKAVQVVLDQLQKNPLPASKRPAFPNYHGMGSPSQAVGVGGKQ
jgi:tricorn protease